MLPETVAEAARRFGDAPALVPENGPAVSYADLDQRSDAAAVALRRRGVGEGDIVGLALPTCPEYVIAYLGAAKLGAVTAGVNPRLAASEQGAMLGIAKIVLNDVEEEDGDPPAPLPNDPDRPVAIVFTSGTTGRPKGAVFCNRQLEGILQLDTGGVWGDGSTRMMASTSLAHVGYMTKLVWYFRTGGPTFLLDRWRADAALHLIADQKLSTVGGVPTQVALMLRQPDFDDLDLSAVQAVILGAGPATVALLREVRERFGAPVSLRYSSTETGGCGTGTAFDDPIDDALGVGKPRGTITVVIRDEEGTALAADEVGEVCVKTPSAFARYHDDPEATAAAFTSEGEVRTGDLGYLDENGRLHLAGRRKEMYVRGGYNVYPAEVEGVLAEHPAVAAVAVVPKPDDVMGELGVAFVVPRQDVSLRELRDFAKRRLGTHKLPDELRTIDALPLTSADKVDKNRLKELAAT